MQWLPVSSVDNHIVRDICIQCIGIHIRIGFHVNTSSIISDEVVGNSTHSGVLKDKEVLIYCNEELIKHYCTDDAHQGKIP